MRCAGAQACVRPGAVTAEPAVRRSWRAGAVHHHIARGNDQPAHAGRLRRGARRGLNLAAASTCRPGCVRWRACGSTAPAQRSHAIQQRQHRRRWVSGRADRIHDHRCAFRLDPCVPARGRGLECPGAGQIGQLSMSAASPCWPCHARLEQALPQALASGAHAAHARPANAWLAAILVCCHLVPEDTAGRAAQGRVAAQVEPVVRASHFLLEELTGVRPLPDMHGRGSGNLKAGTRQPAKLHAWPSPAETGGLRPAERLGTAQQMSQLAERLRAGMEPAQTGAAPGARLPASRPARHSARTLSRPFLWKANQAGDRRCVPGSRPAESRPHLPRPLVARRTLHQLARTLACVRRC